MVCLCQLFHICKLPSPLFHDIYFLYVIKNMLHKHYSNMIYT